MFESIHCSRQVIKKASFLLKRGERQKYSSSFHGLVLCSGGSESKGKQLQALLLFILPYSHNVSEELDSQVLNI